MQRELNEELGANVQVMRRIWQCWTPNGIQLGWWQATLRNAHLMRPNPDEVESFHWLTATEIVKLPQLLATNREFMAALDRREVILDTC